MFKKLLKGLDSTPSTPKIGRMELPDVGDAGVYYISTSQTSAIVQDWSSDSESSSSPRSPIASWRRPSSLQPQNLKPWRKASAPQPESPLSPRRNSSTSQQGGCKPMSRSSTPRSEAKSSCSRTPTPQPGPSRVAERCSSPAFQPAPQPAPQSAKPALKSILKPARPPQPVTLHWQLLPYDSARSKKLIYFDVSQRVEFIHDHSHLPPVALKNSDVEKPAAEIPLSEMQIHCAQLPHWDIRVSQSGPGGIRCLDVYRAIYETFRCKLTDAEKELYIRPGHLTRCEEQFRKRCKASPGLYVVELREGMRRVDLLQGLTIFMGLKRPIGSDNKPDCSWVLELGFPNDSP